MSRLANHMKKLSSIFIYVLTSPSRYQPTVWVDGYQRS